MSNLRKTLEMTSLVFGMTLLFCWIAWHLGYDGFILVGSVYLSYWPLTIICAALLFVQLSLVGSYILNEYSFKICIHSGILVFLAFIMSLIGALEIISGPGATLYFIIFGIIRKTGKRSILRALIITVLTIIYQFIAIALKTGELLFHYSDISTYGMLMFSIDMIIFTLLVWSIGGVKNESNNALELLVFPGRVRDDRNRDESRKSNSQDPQSIPINKFEVWVMRSVIGVVQVLQWMFILWVCSLDNLFLDALVMTTSFICHGMIIAKRKHFKPVILCTLAATAMFYFAARFTISFHYSHFFPILVGLLLAYTVYRISYQFEKAAEEKLRKELRRVDILEQCIQKAWKEIDKLSD